MESLSITQAGGKKYRRQVLKLFKISLYNAIMFILFIKIAHFMYVLYFKKHVSIGRMKIPHEFLKYEQPFVVNQGFFSRQNWDRFQLSNFFPNG